MVFDKKYDNSLKLILSNNRNNNDVIINFIKNIPDKLVYRMQKSILYLFNSFSSLECYNISEYDEILLSSECMTSGDMLYWYMINPQTQALILGECIVDGEEQYDVFQMTLYPLNDMQICHMRNFDRIVIGDISYGYMDQVETNQLNDCIINEFSLDKYPIVGHVVCSTSNVDRKKCFDLVNIEKKLKVEDISTMKKSSSGVVRSRKKNSRY